MTEPKRRETDPREGRPREVVEQATTRTLEHVARARFERAEERREHLAYAPGAPASPVPPPAAKRILVVDDQEVVCSLVERTLTLAGYEVVGETSAREALRRLAETPGGFDLVITNTRMPEMSGWELIGEIRCRWPALRLLRISGYADADDDAPPPEVDPGSVAFLPKPFLPEELVRHVTTVLDR